MALNIHGWQELRANLLENIFFGESKTGFSPRMFLTSLFFSSTPLALTRSIVCNVAILRFVLCYTIIIANEIMNSRLDTKADEGIFEHSKNERGRERERAFPKLIFISRVHPYLIGSA